ncbi:MAG: HAD family hydrolase [Phycisphaerae bacterium]|nr:HAD family hydrolase [Phycisphaerae bacterium]
MPASCTIHVVVFDLDDTLYPERQYVRSGYGAAAAALARQRGESESPRRWANWLWKRFLGGQTQDAFGALSAAFGLQLTQEQIAELVNVYRSHQPAIRPWADMVELLGRLRSRHALGLLSDGYLPGQQRKLDALKLGRFFDAIVFTEALGRDAWKPAKAGFERIASLLDTAHGRCAYVADNPAKDFLAPNELGWRTVQSLRAGQLHAANPAPSGGEPQVAAYDPGGIRAALYERR